jgi:hypothetical protein
LRNRANNHVCLVNIQPLTYRPPSTTLHNIIMMASKSFLVTLMVAFFVAMKWEGDEKSWKHDDRVPRFHEQQASKQASKRGGRTSFLGVPC